MEIIFDDVFNKWKENITILYNKNSKIIKPIPIFLKKAFVLSKFICKIIKMHIVFLMCI